MHAKNGREARVVLQRAKEHESTRAIAWRTAHKAIAQCVHGQLHPGPEDICRSSKGKPYVHPSMRSEHTDVRFNVSHTLGMAAVAVTCSGIELGVDIEVADRAPRRWNIKHFANRWLSPDEADALTTGTIPFAPLWVAKEAIAKASGLGLSGLPPRSFSVLDSEHVTPRLLSNVHVSSSAPRRGSECRCASSISYALHVLLDSSHSHVAAVSWPGHSHDLHLHCCEGIADTGAEQEEHLACVQHPLQH